MIDFNALLNAAFEAAIEAKVAPLREQVKALQAAGPGSITRMQADGEVVLTPEVLYLVRAVAERVLKEHTDTYDHDEFISEDDLGSEVYDKLDDVFQSRFEAALDGTRVTLNT